MGVICGQLLLNRIGKESLVLLIVGSSLIVNGLGGSSLQG